MKARRARWMVAAVLMSMTACAKKQASEQAPPPSVPPLSDVEIKRGVDACAAYLQQVCELAKRQPERPELAQQCTLAPSLSDAMRTAIEIARHPESGRRDVLQAQDSARKTIDTCIEGTAKLAGQ
jgi:hypothetical protein